MVNVTTENAHSMLAVMLAGTMENTASLALKTVENVSSVKATVIALQESTALVKSAIGRKTMVNRAHGNLSANATTVAVEYVEDVWKPVL